MMSPMMRIRRVLVSPWNWSTGKVRTGATGAATPGGEGGPDSRAAAGGTTTVAAWAAIARRKKGQRNEEEKKTLLKISRFAAMPSH